MMKSSKLCFGDLDPLFNVTAAKFKAENAYCQLFGKLS